MNKEPTKVYENGQAFVTDLIATYGKEEGVAKAKRYIQTRKFINGLTKEDIIEYDFCMEIREALWKADKAA